MVYDKLTDNMVKVMRAMLSGGAHQVPKVLKPRQKRLQKELKDEATSRSLGKADIYEPLSKVLIRFYPQEPIPPEDFQFSEVDDHDLLFWEAMGAVIVDFSCLGYGIRPYANQVWQSFQAEAERRGLKTYFFCDVEYGHVTIPG